MLFFNNESFGILITLVSYFLFVKINSVTKKSLVNPLLLSIAFIIFILIFFKIPLEQYTLGGNYIQIFLGPATIVLVLPIYRQLDLLKKHLIPILLGVFVGSLSSLISVYLLSKIFGLKLNILMSLLPKSITTPIGMSISETYGGIVPLTITVIVITGIIGSIIAPTLFKVINIKSDVAKGIAIGTSSHGVGTARAIELGETIGAMSGLAIAIAGTMTAFMMPLFYRIICFIKI